jgi:hypothetical protein
MNGSAVIAVASHSVSFPCPQLTTGTRRLQKACKKHEKHKKDEKDPPQLWKSNFSLFLKESEIALKVAFGHPFPLLCCCQVAVGEPTRGGPRKRCRQNRETPRGGPHHHHTHTHTHTPTHLSAPSMGVASSTRQLGLNGQTAPPRRKALLSVLRFFTTKHNKHPTRPTNQPTNQPNPTNPTDPTNQHNHTTRIARCHQLSVQPPQAR